MSEANKSLMLSEAEIIEAINSDSLISVSLGAGQPQKNVKMSTLATVAAGLMPVYTPNIVKGLATTLNSMTFTSGNLKDCNTNIQGLSVVASDANNLPDGSSHLFTYGGILITLRFGNDAYMLQFLAPRVDGRILYFRIKIDSWLLWNQFALN